MTMMIMMMMIIIINININIITYYYYYDDDDHHHDYDMTMTAKSMYAGWSVCQSAVFQPEQFIDISRTYNSANEVACSLQAACFW